MHGHPFGRDTDLLLVHVARLVRDRHWLGEVGTLDDQGTQLDINRRHVLRQSDKDHACNLRVARGVYLVDLRFSQYRGVHISRTDSKLHHSHKFSECVKRDRPCTLRDVFRRVAGKTTGMRRFAGHGRILHFLIQSSS